MANVNTLMIDKSVDFCHWGIGIFSQNFPVSRRLCRSILLIYLFVANHVSAQVLMTQKEALKLAFPDAVEVERKTVFLTDEQVSEIQSLAKAKVESKIITFYIGKTQDGIQGYAFFETHIVRTMPETFMVVVNANGSLKFVEILAFYEPKDYLPPDRWLQLFKEKRISNELWVKRDIPNISGATLSAQAITAAIRRFLAVFHVVVQLNEREIPK